VTERDLDQVHEAIVASAAGESKRCIDLRTDSEWSVYVATRNFHMLTRRSMAWLTRYSPTQVARAVSDLKGRGLIQSLGYFGGQEWFAAGPRGFPQLPDLCAPTRAKFVAPGKECFFPSVESSTGFRLNLHALQVAIGAAMVCENIHQKEYRCLVYPESQLRHCLRWHSDSREDPTNGYQTTIPDAWFVMPDFSFRLEVQRSPKSHATYRKVVEDDSHHEPILYLTTSQLIARSLRQLHEKEGGKFFVAVLGSQEDFEKWWVYVREWRALEGGTTNPFREKCSQIVFRRYLQNPACHPAGSDWSVA
jgi:hypothetical protein